MNGNPNELTNKFEVTAPLDFPPEKIYNFFNTSKYYYSFVYSFIILMIESIVLRDFSLKEKFEDKGKNLYKIQCCSY